MALDVTTLEETTREMERLLSRLLPPVEIRIKAELVYEILRLKKEKGAIILGHNYMEPALFNTVPDIVGDSLMLSKEAARTTRDPIIFCGVRFMAETAKILNPGKKVLLPAKKAGCSLAESITAEDVRKLRAQYPGIPIIAYINTYADVKAEIDICCTSGNAAKIARAFKDKTIIFLPDEYLAKNIAAETGKEILVATREGGHLEIKEARPVMIGWTGKCEVHEKFTVDDIVSVRKQFPEVVVLSHPECHPDVVKASDYSGSTSQMVDYMKKSTAPKHLILTECSMADNIIAENPGKEVLRMCSLRCPHMAEITLEDTLNTLRNGQYEIDVPEDIRLRAKKSLDRMLEYI